MKAVVLEGPRKASVKEVDDPKVGRDEVLIEVAASGICGGDLSAWVGRGHGRYPKIPGHEYSGTIVALGEEVQDLQVGQPVTVDPCLHCGRCRFCRESRFNFCENRVIRSGGFAEYVSVRRENVFPCEGLSLEEAAVVEPVACGVHAFKLLGSCLADNVLLFGCGSQGLILLQLSRLQGAATITAVDRFDMKLELAQKLGADRVLKADAHLDKALRDLGPFDLIINATSQPKVAESMFHYVSKGSKLLFFGVCPPDATIEISPYQVYAKDLKIFGSNSLSGDFEQALRLVLSGAINVRPLITHRFSLEEFTTGIEKMDNPVDSIKILVKPS